MYKLTPNRRDLGSHVSNASFMVHPDAAGRGIGSVMGRHSLEEARRQGYEAMQFNFVVSTNERAVSLWQRLGFRIVGTLPNAFRHGTRGMVDALVMYRLLDDIVLVFGKERGAATRVRHCAYAVLSGESADGRSCVALVRAREDILLPGGGLDPGEDHRDRRGSGNRGRVRDSCPRDPLTGRRGTVSLVVETGGRWSRSATGFSAAQSTGLSPASPSTRCYGSAWTRHAGLRQTKATGGP